MTFVELKKKFDNKYSNKSYIRRSFVPVNGKFITDVSIKDKKGNPSEEYYKWQFIYSMKTKGSRLHF